MAGNGKGYTTISVHEETRDRVKKLKPFDSMSYNEFLQEMADVYEEEQ